MHSYSYLGYKVIFSDFMLDNKVLMCIPENTIIVPESLAYKFIFMGQVNDITVQVAINHAICKINRFIDNYKS